ncbi:hypothetical protein DYB30_011514 [Aphanomyces astaci]|uniref:Myotubularin phosphatase domain-containing protein n=1 Tax=Aphanomyces astaci TaxID=112090 RepID=A0A397CLL1_APHAT|nr:hypothetical protein DYB34_005611 [Aphanomyces astaci]RHY48261.1 hypothetical protein DYB30_011514 [Aphanomyces astaci]RHZ31517.1 hypothetical protein DYB26_004285 [Aphanomyces astaci]
MTSSMKIPSIDDIDEHELMQFDRQGQFDSSTMERLLQAEQSVLKAAQATMDASNMMNFNSKGAGITKATSSGGGTGIDEAPASTYTSYCVPADFGDNAMLKPHPSSSLSAVVAGAPTSTPPLPRLKYPSAAPGYDMSFEIPRSEEWSTSSSAATTRSSSMPTTTEPSDGGGDAPPAVRKMASQPIFGVKASSSVVNGMPPTPATKGSDSIYTFTVKKADNILDQMSKKSTVLVQIDTHRRMLCFLTPTNPTDKEEFSCAAVNAKSYQKFGLHLRIEKGGQQAPVMNRKITFFGADDRDRFMEALEQGKVMYKTPAKKAPHHHHLHAGGAGASGSHESSDSFEDLDQWLIECSHTSFPVQDPDLELSLLEGEHVVEHVQRVTNMVVISQKERAVQGVMKITNYRIAFMPYDTSARYGSFQVPLAALLPIVRDGLKLNLPCKDLRKIYLSMHDAYTHKNYYDAPPQTPDIRWIQLLMTKMRPQISITSLFAFTYKAAKVDAGQVTTTSMDMNPWLVYSPMKEYQRLGFLSNDDDTNDAITWRLLKNPKCRFSQTYPQLMVVPSCMTEEQLVHSARFRSRGRLPIVVWRHPDNKCVLARSSQPNYGLQSKRCEADRILLKSYRDSANKNSGGVAPPLHIVDARKNLATQGNRFKGKGVENSSHYDGAVVEFLGIANIHKMRDSVEMLQSTFG